MPGINPLSNQDSSTLMANANMTLIYFDAHDIQGPTWQPMDKQQRQVYITIGMIPFEIIKIFLCSHQWPF